MNAVKQLGRLDKAEAKRITTFLRHRLATPDDPRSTGKALTGPQFGAYWRYRVGDYRIICDIQDGALCILVIEAGNRRDIYR
ncbi:MAG: addiction module toxin RelE [Hydrogenophilales bacterium 12-64-13]|nr:MAG: addiction module toxin RelE [Hydrogenophilales bacterium 12-64-13]